MNTLDIVIPYEEYSKGSIENPKLLLEFDLDEDGDSKKKIGFTDIIKTRIDIIAPHQYKKNTVEIDTSGKRIVVYKKNKHIRFSIEIIIRMNVFNVNRSYFTFKGETIEKTPDFKLEYNSIIGYTLTLFFDDYNIWEEVFNDENYINELINKFFKWFDKNKNINYKNKTDEENNIFDFDFKKMMESGEYKDNIAYESDSCIIIME